MRDAQTLPRCQAGVDGFTPIFEIDRQCLLMTQSGHQAKRDHLITWFRLEPGRLWHGLRGIQPVILIV
jgi:hypothetical protein